MVLKYNVSVCRWQKLKHRFIYTTCNWPIRLQWTKVTSTSSWIKSVCHKLTCITSAIKLLDIYNNQPLQRAFGYNTNFATVHSQSDGRHLLGGVWVQTSMSVHSCCCTQNATYRRFIYLYDIAAGPYEAFLAKKIYPVRQLCLCSYWVPVFWVPSSLSATAALIYSEIWGKTLHVACSELL